MKNLNSNFLNPVLGLAVVVWVALWSVWPMIVRLDRVADYGKDGMYMAAVQMNWHKKISDYIRHNNDPKMKFFDGYFFYAEKNSLAYSDMLFITSLFNYWPAKLSKIYSIVSGLALIEGQLLMMIISYALFAKMSKSVLGGVVGAVAFGLSQIHFMYQVHLHTWIMQYWLIGFWLFSEKKYFLSAVFLGLQMWESPLGCYFGLFMIIVREISNFKLENLNRFLISKYSIFILTFGLIAFLPAKAYWEVSNYYHYVRTIRDAAYHGLNLNNWDGFGSWGLFLLFVFLLSRIFRIRPSLLNKNLKFFSLLIVLSYILALGPVLKWSDKTIKIGGVVPIPMPYAAAYYTVPGWQAFRVPSRWLVIMGWGMAGMVAIGLSNLKFKNYNFQNSNFKLTQLIGVLGCLVVAIVGGTHITRYIDLPRVVPTEYLGSQEVLVFKPRGGEQTEIERMYFSILAGKKTMNGYSGFLPPERVKWLNE